LRGTKLLIKNGREEEDQQKFRLKRDLINVLRFVKIICRIPPCGIFQVLNFHCKNKQQRGGEGGIKESLVTSQNQAFLSSFCSFSRLEI